MKKYLILLIFILLICVGSCKKKTKVTLDSIYGKYYYDECVYLSSFAAGSTIEEENKTYSNVSRFALREDAFYYYKDASPDATSTIRNVFYEEKDVYDGLVSNEKIKSILKNNASRFDIIKNNKNQGYAFVFDDNMAYYVELRYITSDSSYDVWQIVKLRKAVGE